jgi:glycosyltransferase involved in cell wall biosynthesis
MGILRSAKHNLAYRLMASRYDVVLAVSDQVRHFCITQDRLCSEAVVTLYNGVDLNAIARVQTNGSLRQALGLESTSHVIIAVANVRRIKGLDILLRTAAQVRRDFPHAVFLVVGKVLERKYCEELQALQRELGLEGTVRFLGPREDVLSLLKISDIFFLPSRSEGFSNALLEAMACGLPCVATDVGGNQEAIQHNVTGFIVPPEDVDSAAASVATLLRNPENAASMGRAGRDRVERKFDVRTMVAKLTAIYERALLEHASRS